MGQEWLDTVESGWTDSSLHSLVVTSGTLSAAKAKELYGHFRSQNTDEEPSWPVLVEGSGDDGDEGAGSIEFDDC